MNIAIPDEIPLRALAGALATLGLVLDGSSWSDGIHRARWASECLGTRCNEPGCVLPASISLGKRRYCASHAGYHMIEADLAQMDAEDASIWLERAR